MTRRPPNSQGVGASRHGDRRRSEAGDTLVEILIALTVIAIASTAILLAFATSISGSGAHRNVTTMDTMLRTAAAEVAADIQQQGSTVFANCTGAYTVNTTPGSIPLPAAGYTATITGAQYWLVSGTPFTFSSFAAPTNAGCPSGYYAPPPAQPGQPGPQQLTVQVSFNGTHQSITTVVQDPISASSTTNCLFPASQLVWVQQPDNGNAGSALFPAPTVVVEDKTGCVVQNDLSQVKLAINSGPNGATLSNCVPNLGYGETTFQNCSLSTIGTYTLSVTDPTDGINTPVVGNPFSITAGVPAQLKFIQQPGNGTGGTALTTQPTVQIEDASGNPIQGDSSTVTLAIGTNPGSGTLSGCTSTTTNGVATFAGCKIDKAGNGYTLTATDAADNLTVPSPPSAPFNITVGPAFQLGFTTSPGTTVAGDVFGTQPVVTIQDAGGNTVTTNTSAVSLSIGTNPAGGTLSGCTETTTAGVATFTGCKIDKPGNGYTLTATDGTLQPATSNAFNIVMPALTSFKVTPATSTPTAGTPFNVTITGLDQSGFTFPGLTGPQTIAFTGPSNSPNGTAPVYPANVTFAGGTGTASVTLYDAQTTKLTATQGSVTGTSGNITVSPLAAPVSFTVPNPGTQTAGIAFSETITAADQYGNAASGYTGNHTLTFSGPANAPNGKAPNYTNPVNFSGGVGTTTITLYKAQSTTLTASATTPTLTGTSTSFTVNPGAPGSFGVANPGTQTAGTAFNVTITATDAYGNAAANYSGAQTIAFSGPSNSPNGTAPVYPASVTFANGVGTASSITLYDAQTTSLTVTQGGATGNSGNFTVNGTGTVSTFVLSNIGTQTAGTAFNVTITAADPYGNASAGYAGTKVVTFGGPSNSPNGHVPTYPASVTFAGGVGTASITLYDAQATTLTATATGPNLTGTSNSFTVNARSATAFSITNPGTQTVGTQFTLTITAVDAYGNTDTGYNPPNFSTVNLTGPANAPDGTAPNYQGNRCFFGCFTNGVLTPQVTLYDAQTTTITASVNGISGTSTSFTVNPGGTVDFNVTGYPSPTTAGVASNITVTAVDANDNVTTGYTGTVHFTSSDAQAVVPANYTFTGGDAGTHVFSVTLKTAGTQSITATDTVTGSITGTQSVSVLSAAATTLTVSGYPSPTTAGAAHNVTVTAHDGFGNVATGYTGTVHFTSSDARAALPANYTFTGGDAGTHVFSVSLKSLGTQSITATDTVTGSITGTQSGITVNLGPPTNLVVSGFTNPTTAGAAHNVTVTAQDAGGNVATGYTGTVHFTSSDAQAGLPANYTFTGGDAGTHVFSVTLKTAGTQSITATDTVTGSITGTQSGITVNVGPTTNLVVSGFTSPTTAGAAHNVTVSAQDAFGNVTTGYTGTVHFTSSDGSAVLPANYTFTGGDAGTHVFSVTLKTAGTQSITATDTVTGSITGTQNVTVNPAGASTLTVSGYPSPTTAGAAHNVTVTAHDGFGNVATGYTGTVHFTSSDAQAVLPANYTFTGGDAGTHVFSVTLKTAGTQSITATDTVTGSITGTQSGITVNVGPTTNLVVSGFTSPTTAGAAHNVTVSAQDAFGNVTTGYTGTVHFTSSDGSAVLPANYTFTGGDAGTHVFSVTLKTAGTQSITATDTVTGSITGTQNVTVNPAGASTLTVSGYPSPTTAGAAHNVTVTAHDGFGNVATGYTGTVHFTSSDAQAVLPANYTFTGGDAGTHVFSVTLKTAGTQSITATDTVTGTITGTQSGITVNPASATTYTVSGFTSPTTAGAAHNVTVTAQDAFGNVATGYTGTVHLTSSDSSATLPANYTFTGGDAGTHVFSVTLKTAGTQSITATDTVTGSITGTQSGITVNAAAPNKLGFVQQPTTTQAGTAISPALTVQVQDQYGNAVADSGATVAMTVSTGPGSFTGTSTTSAITNGSGLATFNNLVLNTAGNTYSVQASSSLLVGTSSVFTVNPASATTYTVSGFTSPTTAGAAHNVTVTAHDAFGNVATGYTGTVHLTSSDSSATLPANYTFTGGDAGTHVFSVTLKTAGTQSITATDTVTGTITGTQSGITVNPAGAATLTVSGFPSPTTAGGAHNVTVTAQDAFGNVATGYTGTVHFTSNDASAVLPANYTFTGGDAGTHVFSVTLKTVGTRSITATDTVTGTITGTESVSVLSGPATTMIVSGFTSPTTAGVAHNVTVTAQDAFGNVATGYTGTVHLTSSDASAVLPANYTFTGADNGVHNLSVTLKTAGSQSITATDTVTGTITGTQSGITVNPAGAATLTVSGFTSPTNAGTAHNVTVTGQDAFGNVATGYTGTVHFTSSDGRATLPANYTFTGGDAGTHVFSATLKTPGTQSITATDTVTGSITGTQSGITVNLGPTATFVVSGFTSPTTAGAAHNVTVTAEDAGGNVTSGYTGTVHLTSSDVQAVLPANYTFTTGAGKDNGIHVLSVTLKTAGSQSITATDTVTGTITGTQSGITVQAGPATTITATSGSGQSVNRGNAFPSPLVAVVTDAYGNGVSGISVTFTAPSVATPSVRFATSGTNVEVDSTDSTGTATSSTMTADNHRGNNYSITATAPGLNVVTYTESNT